MPSDYFKQRNEEIRAEMLARLPSPEEELRRQRKLAAAIRRQAKRDAIGHVYFLRSGNAVKIGFSTNLAKRQEAIRISCAEPAFICRIVVGDRASEKFFHKRFAEYRLRGEWFDLRGRLAKYLERYIHPIDLPPQVKIETDDEIIRL